MRLIRTHPRGGGETKTCFPINSDTLPLTRSARFAGGARAARKGAPGAPGRGRDRPPEMIGKASGNPAAIVPANTPEMSGNRSAEKPPSRRGMDRESDGGRSRETIATVRRNGGGPLTGKAASGGSGFALGGCRRRRGEMRGARRRPRGPRLGATKGKQTGRGLPGSAGLE